MTITAHINIETPTGRRFVREMAKYPQIIEFENNSKIGEKTYTVDEVYNQGLDKLSELYGVDMRKLKSQL